MQPANVENCRVLEIGCASGGNLIPMAELLPESRFLGIDASARQVEMGQKVIEELGFKNVRLQKLDIRDVNLTLGQFDYIICHGVFSWVPRPVQDKILTICRDHLSPHGVAYVSYNTYPGWHMRGMIRDMMGYHAKRFADPAQRVAQARALLDFMAQAVAGQQTAHSVLLKTEVEALRQASDSYLFHEQLEETNDPLYFHQFVERAAAKGLQYLGEAEISAMWLGNLPAPIANTLRGLSTDIVQMEQFMDFLRNRMFRQTLLCHKNIQVQRWLKPVPLPAGIAGTRGCRPVGDQSCRECSEAGPATWAFVNSSGSIPTWLHWRSSSESSWLDRPANSSKPASPSKGLRSGGPEATYVVSGHFLC
jgi:SAM-dependent methyltransferase